MITLDRVTKVFGTGVPGLTEVSLSVDKGEFVFLVGPSGAGKTTLFRLLIREMLPTKGTIIINQWDLAKLPDQKIPHLRKKIGVVFQDLKLLPNRTIFENISMPLDFIGMDAGEARKRVDEILYQVGLSQHAEKFPVQLSGGELQRVAIARALILAPDILLADEPTGNLDPDTSWEIVKLLDKINELGTTVIMATHNTEIVDKMKKRVVRLEKGQVVKDQKGHHSAKAKETVEDKKEEVEKEKKSKVDAESEPSEDSHEGPKGEK